MVVLFVRVWKGLALSRVPLGAGGFATSIGQGLGPLPNGPFPHNGRIFVQLAHILSVLRAFSLVPSASTPRSLLPLSAHFLAAWKLRARCEVSEEHSLHTGR